MAKNSVSERLILEVVEGPLTGQVCAIPANGTCVIGRLPECDLSIPQDMTVSRQHCRIEFQPPDCRLIHLSQTGDTTVNGQPVTTSQLVEGDLISFGSGNSVRVRKERSSELEATIVPGRVESAKAMDQFTKSAVSCGLLKYQSVTPDLGFERVLEIVSQSGPVHAMLDFQRMKQATPDELADGQFLFSWMSAEMRPKFSPVLATLGESPAAATAVRECWGKDGIVCFGSKLQGTELLDHWRRAIGVKDNEPGGALTVYYWPSLLNLILTCQSVDQVTPLLSGLTWILVECPDAPGNWRVFADEKFAAVLTAAKLICVNPPESVK